MGGWRQSGRIEQATFLILSNRMLLDFDSISIDLIDLFDSMGSINVCRNRHLSRPEQAMLHLIHRSGSLVSK